MRIAGSRRVLVLLLPMLFMLPAAAVSAASIGQSCKKVGALSATKSGGKSVKIVCTKVGKKLRWVAKVDKSVDACATGGVCVLGNIGPGGGIVFYDAGSQQPWGRYLEAAPSGWNGGTSDPEAEWGCQNNSYSEARNSAIGTGRINTAVIVRNCATAGIAARLADDLTFGGQSDWFLPSKTELGYMYTNRALIGVFAANYYWSSTEGDGSVAYSQYFANGVVYDSGKSLRNVMRPVRAFG